MRPKTILLTAGFGLALALAACPALAETYEAPLDVKKEGEVKFVAPTKAEASAEKADQIGPELAARCRQMFVDRLNYTRQHLPEPFAMPFLLTFHQGWQDLDARLFALAAEVAAKTKPPPR